MPDSCWDSCSTAAIKSGFLSAEVLSSCRIPMGGSAPSSSSRMAWISGRTAEIGKARSQDSAVGTAGVASILRARGRYSTTS